MNLNFKEKNHNLILESIKIAIGTTSYLGISINKSFREIISRLMYYYTETKEISYLRTAFLHMEAYMQMGFEYEDNKELFDNVLIKLGTSRNEVFPKKMYKATKIKLTKQDVKRMILKWPPSNHRMNIDEVIDDIIYKVSNHMQGIFYYNSDPTPDSEKSKGGDLYELVINADEIYFHDIKRRRYFIFQI